jgi:hypothetical protein
VTEIALADTTHLADSFSVLGVGSTSPMPVVLLADLRKHLNWPTSKGTEDDDELLALAASCEDTIEGYLGRPIRTAQVTEHHYAEGAALALRRNPCPCTTCSPYRTIAIDSVVEDGSTLSASDYTLDAASGLLYRGTTIVQSWVAITPAGVAVTYTAGYTSTPPWVAMAQKRFVEHLWTKSQQSRHSRGGSEPAGDSASPTYLLPYLVQSILSPHRAPGF